MKINKMRVHKLSRFIIGIVYKIPLLFLGTLLTNNIGQCGKLRANKVVNLPKKV